MNMIMNQSRLKNLISLFLTTVDLYSPPQVNTLAEVNTSVGTLCLQADIHQINIQGIC